MCRALRVRPLDHRPGNDTFLVLGMIPETVRIHMRHVKDIAWTKQKVRGSFWIVSMLLCFRRVAISEVEGIWLGRNNSERTGVQANRFGVFDSSGRNEQGSHCIPSVSALWVASNVDKNGCLCRNVTFRFCSCFAWWEIPRCLHCVNLPLDYHWMFFGKEQYDESDIVLLGEM